MMYWPTFTERKTKPKDRYSYELSNTTRLKLWHILRQHEVPYGHYHVGTMLNEVQGELLKRRGFLERRDGQSAGHAALDHFDICSSDEALDFIELCFQTRSLSFGGEPQTVVEQFNRVSNPTRSATS